MTLSMSEYDQKLKNLRHIEKTLVDVIESNTKGLAEVRKQIQEVTNARPVIPGDQIKVVQRGQTYYPQFCGNTSTGQVAGFTEQTVAGPSSVNNGDRGFIIAQYQDNRGVFAVRFTNGLRVILDRKAFEFVD